MATIEIASNVHIPEEEIEWNFVRASGPGGQNVNKVSSKAVLMWNVDETHSLPFDAKTRLYTQQKRRFSNEGVLQIASQRFRDQERNREDCIDKLREMIEQALKKPKPRKKTRPTRASKERRLQSKRQQSERKARRKPPRHD